jgi:hypothetical protein
MLISTAKKKKKKKKKPSKQHLLLVHSEVIRVEIDAKTILIFHIKQQN